MLWARRAQTAPRAWLAFQTQLVRRATGCAVCAAGTKNADGGGWCHGRSVSRERYLHGGRTSNSNDWHGGRHPHCRRSFAAQARAAAAAPAAATAAAAAAGGSRRAPPGKQGHDSWGPGALRQLSCGSQRDMWHQRRRLHCGRGRHREHHRRGECPRLPLTKAIGAAAGALAQDLAPGPPHDKHRREAARDDSTQASCCAPMPSALQL